MRFMKKFGALALATVTVAASVWYVTPALQALASAYIDGRVYKYNGSDYVEADDGDLICEDGHLVPYTQQDQGVSETDETDETGDPADITLVKAEYVKSRDDSGIGLYLGEAFPIYIFQNNDGYSYGSHSLSFYASNYPVVEDFGSVKVTSSDSSIASIEDRGSNEYTDAIYLVKCLKQGKANINVTFTFKDGSKQEFNYEIRVYERQSRTVVDASPSSSSSSSSSTTPASVPTKVVAPNGQTLLQYTAIGAKNTLMAAPEGIVPQGAILAQYEVKEDSQTYEVAKTILGLRVPNATLAKVLDFNLSAKQGTLIHQLDGRVAISFDIPTNFTVPAGYVPRVYRFNDNGTVTACETILDQGKVVFGTDHFSTFALVLEKAPKAAKAK